MSENIKVKTSKTLINTIIGVLIMFLFRFIPISLPDVTNIGMAVIGVFIGTIYLWITVDDPIWTSVISMCMLVYANFFDMNTMLATFWGNNIVILTLFLIVMSNSLEQYGITPHMARSIVQLKIVRGKPYMFMAMVGIISFVMGAFVSSACPLFIFWPVLSKIYKDAGYKRGDEFPKIMSVYLLVTALLGMPMTPYKSNPLVVLNQFRTIIQNGGSDMAFNFVDAKYMAADIIISFAIQIVIVLVVKFILKPDVSKMQNIDYKKLEEDKLEPLKAPQIILSIAFILMIVLMLLPSLFTNVGFITKLGSLTLGIPMIFAGILAAVRIKDQPIIKIGEILNNRFQWGQIFMVGAAIILSNALTNPVTGVSAMLQTVLSPMLSTLGITAFMVVFVLMIWGLTNAVNSLVVIMLVEPILYAYCAGMGINPVPILSILIMVGFGTAIITPSASPFAAMLHGYREWTDSKDIYKYTIIFSVIEVIIFLVLGIPFVNAIL